MNAGKYRIAWRAKETDATGHGEPIFKFRETAEYTAEQLNKESPFVYHWVEYVAAERDESAQEETQL
jgi:hypothetical protein